MADGGQGFVGFIEVVRRTRGYITMTPNFDS